MAPMTDAEYQVRRNRLIPTAVKYADKVAGPEPKSAKLKKEMSYEEREAWKAIIQPWYKKWNGTYHPFMQKLAREAGLI